MTNPTSFRPDPAYARTIGADIDDGRYVIGFGLIALTGVFVLLAVTALLRWAVTL